MQENLHKYKNIKERIIYFIEDQRIKKIDFFNKIGMSSANFRGNQLSSSLNSGTIEIIITHFPEINLYWLITGKGAMLHSKNDYLASNINMASEPVISYMETEVILELKKTIELLNDEKAVLYRLLEAHVGNRQTGS